MIASINTVDININHIKQVNIMFEKVNPSHPDKVADRIAGAIDDLC